MEYENYPIDELYHHGIKGMKWGIRRFQNKDGSLTKAGKKRYDAEMEKIKAETKKVKNQQRTAAKLKKLEDAKKNLDDLKKGTEQKKDDPKEDIETKKARILESRSAKQLYDNANLFTTNELNAAKLRLQLEADIKRMEPAKVDKGKEFTNRFVERADQMTSVINSGTKTYNSMAKVFNALYGNGHGKSLPLINDSVTSKLDKFKEETEWMKAKNERKKAQDEAKPKVKTDIDKLKEETARIDAENKNREVKRTSRRHDKSDAEEAAKKAKEEAKLADEMNKYEEYRKQYTDTPKSNSTESSTYRNSGGERTYSNPNESRSLTVYNAQPDSFAGTKTVNSGKSYAADNNTMVLSTNVVSRIGTLTSGGKYTNAEIAKQLGVSTSTVSKYSNGRDYVDKMMTYDENGNFIGYWSERMTEDGFI